MLLHLGLRLDGLRRAEGRMLSHLIASLLAALALAVVGVAAVLLRQRYGVLSEKHARAEAALRRRDRLAAMGELASTVAHEVRNPLNAIAMSAQRLRREFLETVPVAGDDRAEATALLEVVGGETRRINGIVQQFLEFARPPKLSPRPVSLGPFVAAIAESAQPMAAERGVALAAEVAAAGEANVDAGQLRQALDNLLRNAIEATPSGGHVTVKAQSSSDGHTIEVSDTGGGIDADHLPRIFDLYFTTKADGTGVGLAVTQQIVTAHDGTIEVDSRPGAGTSMTIRLPRVREADRG
jgi:signal transduction histidine kinase